MNHSPQVHHQINSVYEIAWRERAYLLASAKAGQVNNERWEVYIAFLGKAGLHSMAKEMRSHLEKGEA